MFGRHGNQRTDGPIVFRQVLAGDTLNIFGRHCPDSFDKLVDFLPPSADGFSLSEQHGMPEVGVLFEDMGGFDLVLRPLEFLLCRRIGLEAFDLSMEGVLDHLRFLAWAHEGIEVEKARIGLQQAVFCSDCKRRLLLVYEALVQARAFPMRQNRIQNVERVRIFARKIRHAIAHHDERDLRISLEEEAAFTFCSGSMVAIGLGSGPRGIGSKSCLIVGSRLSALMSPTTTRVALLGE